MLHHVIFPCRNKFVEKYMVLLHGFGGNHRVWKKQIPVLQEKYNVLAINLPSHFDGNIKLTELSSPSLSTISKEIICVLDKYRIKSASFMGVSLGTVFIKYMEMYFPQYVKNAVLVGAIGDVGNFLKRTVDVFSIIGNKLPFTLVYRVFARC